tara:strand:+ start:1734 stop:2030 length:297 start_codon:yes stop_codon:yes gene_type:complete
MSLNTCKLYDILLQPISTEKSALMEAHSEYGFYVDVHSAKAEIKQAVERLFNVQVERVRTLSVKGKVKRSGRHMGVRKDRKKAYVRLLPGQIIEFDKV